MPGILEKVVESPRRSPAVPSASGRFILFEETTHSLSAHKTLSRILVADVATGRQSEISLDDGDSNCKWVEPLDRLIWQRKNGDTAELWTCLAQDPSDNHIVAQIHRDATLVQVVTLPDDDLAVLLLAAQTLGKDAAWPHSTGKCFQSLPCVTFDQGLGRSQHSLLYMRIPSPEQHVGLVSEPQTAIWNTEPVDVLTETDLEFHPYSGAMPNISAPNCAISSSGIAFMAVSKGVRTSNKFSCESYFAALPPPGKNFSPPFHLKAPGCIGLAGSPVFSRDGKSLAFLREQSDRVLLVSASIFIIRDISRSLETEAIDLVDRAGKASSLYPDSVQFSIDRSALLFSATHLGRQKIFRVGITGEVFTPEQIAPNPHERGSIMNYHVVENTTGKEVCFMTRSTLVTPNWFVVLNLKTGATTNVPDLGLASLGLSHKQISEIWYDSNDRQIHAFVLRPSGFDKTKSYPVAMLIHGGPMSAWLDSFHPRWAPAVFAEQGYIVVMPNFTGSTGYSQQFRADVWGDPGGQAYRDIEAGLEYIAKTMPYADTDRAVCLGGSFGGQMALWIAGQSLAKRFQCLVAHAPSMFGSTAVYSSDVTDWLQNLFIGLDEEVDQGDLNGWVDRWDPSRHADMWSTPLLLTHGALDNRCPVSSSVAAFTHLQKKGIDSRLLIFPDESHFILKAENWYHWFSEMLAWIDKYAK